MVSVRLGRKHRAHQTGRAERRLGLILFAPHGSSCEGFRTPAAKLAVPSVMVRPLRCVWTSPALSGMSRCCEIVCRDRLLPSSTNDEAQISNKDCPGRFAKRSRMRLT